MVRKQLSITELGQMIKRAEQAKISPQMQVRLLKLYLATDTAQLLSEWGVFFQCHFNQLARLLHVKSPSELVRAVVGSGWFIIGRAPEGENSFYPIVWFASPLFVDESELKHAMEQPDAPAAPVGKLTFENTVGGLFATPNRDSQLGAVNYLLYYTGSNNITLSGRKKTASSDAMDAPSSISHAQEGSDREPYRRDSDAVREQQVLDFIGQVRQSAVYRDMFNGIIRQLTDPQKKRKLGVNAPVFSAGEAKEILRLLMFDHVKKYFVGQDRFFVGCSAFSSRAAWLQTLLYSGYGKRMLGQAIRQFQRMKCKAQVAHCTEGVNERRSHRPVSPHEWMEEGNRYYQDSVDGVVCLPPDAAPRPSASSHWNFVSLDWYE